jgi:hypothetical protein
MSKNALGTELVQTMSWSARSSADTDPRPASGCPRATASARGAVIDGRPGGEVWLVDGEPADQDIDIITAQASVYVAYPGLPEDDTANIPLYASRCWPTGVGNMCPWLEGQEAIPEMAGPRRRAPEGRARFPPAARSLRQPGHGSPLRVMNVPLCGR